ncbi:MAG: undecaprenyl-diphosphate phosphatase [Bacteroidetes bacterium]|nr:undecaprenyl-diphosphate phosphatase [Bacteroidota bacterium]
MVLVGVMLVFTAALLFLTTRFNDRGVELSFIRAFLIGIAQAVAVIPGVSRSGATISAGMILGIRRDRVAEFSFLMVLLPVIGANILELADSAGGPGSGGIATIIIGFAAAFVSGLFACRIMIALVRRSKMWWFSLYCLAVGVMAIIFG